MKKIVAFAMAGMLALSTASFAFAEEENIQTVDISMVDPDLYEGSWVTAFDCFDLFLPNDWVITYNAQEGDEPEDEILFSAASEDESRNIAIQFTPDVEVSLDDLMAGFTEEGIEDLSLVDVNGLPGVAYSMDEDGVIAVGFASPVEGGMFNFILAYGEDDTEFEAIGRNIVCSISVTGQEAEAETEAETEA